MKTFEANGKWNVVLVSLPPDVSAKYTVDISALEDYCFPQL